jgi:hypothetical protein
LERILRIKGADLSSLLRHQQACPVELILTF